MRYDKRVKPPYKPSSENISKNNNSLSGFNEGIVFIYFIVE